MALVHGLILGIGGLLVAVPIVLHLLMQPKPKQYQFPAIRFVTAMHRTNQRSLRLRHWLLLLLRCLLILALAAAFARPSTPSEAFGNWLILGGGVLLCLLLGLLLVYALAWSKPPNMPLAILVGGILALVISFTGYMAITAMNQDGQHILADQQAPVAVGVIVDNSPRMTYRFENQTRFEKAKDNGRWIMSQLPLGSQVAVVPTNTDKPFYSVDLSAARKRLNTLDVNYAATPVTEKLSQVIDLLADSELQRKEIYVLTDLTSPSWSSSNSLHQQLADQSEISLFVIDVGVEDAANLSIAPLQLTSTSIPAQGQLEIETNVSAQGPGKSTLVKLMLEQPDPTRPTRRDGKTLVPDDHWVDISNLEISDNSIASTRLTLRENFKPGIHHGTIEIQSGDSLAVDDRRFFTIEVRPSWKVLVVNGRDVQPGNLIDTLDPRLDENDTSGMYSIDVIGEADLPPPNIDEYRVVFLLDPYNISDAIWNLLKNYVEKGGSLAVFLGHNAATKNDARGSFQTAAAGEVLPGKLQRVWRRPDGSLFLKMDQMSHPSLRRFRSMATLGIWQPFPIFRHWELDVTDPSVQVIARFTNNMPSILEKPVGDGKVICVTTPITESVRPEGRERWNDLFNSTQQAVWPAWLLVSELSRYLASGSRDQLNINVGQTAILHQDPELHPAEYRLYSPREEDPETIRAGGKRIRYRFTNTPGSYRLKGELDGTVLRGFSANLPAGSSDLTRIAADKLNAMLGDDRYQLGRERDEIQRQQGASRLGQEFYPILALMMSLILALELIMSNRFYRKAN